MEDWSTGFTPDGNQHASVEVGAAIAAYARIAIARFKSIPGNPLLYTNTDSVYLEHPLDPDMEQKYVSKRGNELGKLKYEGGGTDFIVAGKGALSFLPVTEGGQGKTSFTGPARGVDHD